jgi:polyphosphate kinase
MRSRLLELIDRETRHRKEGKPARIVAKMNQLEDPQIIEALVRASQAGVPVDLIIRGFCCLRPGVPGRTENIRVRSIIGRFLEHSRIYHFANDRMDPEEGEFLIGSADWMQRNLSRRVEVITPVRSPDGKRKLWEALHIFLNDHRQAWELNSDGSYSRLYPEHGSRGPESLGTHHVLMELARERSSSPDASN